MTVSIWVYLASVFGAALLALLGQWFLSGRMGSIPPGYAVVVGRDIDNKVLAKGLVKIHALQVGDALDFYVDEAEMIMVVEEGFLLDIVVYVQISGRRYGVYLSRKYDYLPRLYPGDTIGLDLDNGLLLQIRNTQT